METQDPLYRRETLDDSTFFSHVKGGGIGCYGGEEGEGGRKDLVCPDILIHLLIMSRKATSAKISISSEATSPDNHMTAVDRRLTLDESASAKEVKSDSPLFLDELQVGLTGTIFVMLCRIWDVSAVTGRYLSTDMVVSDARVSHDFQYFSLKSKHAVAVVLYVKTFYLQGNAIHCSVRSNVAHNFIKLKEGVIYCIKNFVVHPNKEEYRIRKDDAFMLEFNRATSARKSLAKGVGFVRHPFQLVELNSVELTDNKYMIDVDGYIANVRRSIQQRTCSRTLDFYLANERSEIRVMDQTKQIMPVDFNLSVAFICQVRIANIRTRNGWNFPTCSGKIVRKELAESSGDGSVQLELGISDATAHVVVVMFDVTASELVKYSANSLAQSNEEYLDETSGLPAALANIIGTTHTLELKSHTYYEHGTFKSFTCWNLIPLEVVVESAGSSIIDVVRDTPWSSGKRLCKQPAVPTPLKVCEGKTPISQELEDSYADSLPVQAEGGRKSNVCRNLRKIPCTLALPKLPMRLEGFYDVRDDVKGLTAWKSMPLIERKGRGKKSRAEIELNKHKGK
ncbi:hypothetical protein Tco_0672630 [Tanacetum coccineum]